MQPAKIKAATNTYRATLFANLTLPMPIALPITIEREVAVPKELNSQNIPAIFIVIF